MIYSNIGKSPLALPRAFLRIVEKKSTSSYFIDMYKKQFKEVTKTILNTLDNKTLFVIGNGFDLAHDLPTKYADFKKRIRPNSSLCHALKQYVDTDCWWKDLEESLSKIKFAEIINPREILSGFYFENKYNENDVESFNKDIEELIRPIKILTYDLTRCFKNWIDRLSTKVSKYPFNNCLSKDALYLNFNYTDVLEYCYSIPQSNVCHIHGERRKSEKEIIIGHSLEENNDYKEKDFQSMTEAEKEIVWGIIEKAFDHLGKYLGMIEKDCEKIIQHNEYFFLKIKKVNTIVVLGHSLGKIDYPYFAKIIDSLPKNTSIEWLFSYHSEMDIESIETFTKTFKIKKNNVEILKLGN